ASADHPRYIETPSRRGYRFIAPLNGTDAQSADRVRITSPSAAQAQAAFSGRGLWQKAVVALLAVAIVGWGWRHWRKQAPTPAGPVIRITEVREMTRRPWILDSRPPRSCHRRNIPATDLHSSFAREAQPGNASRPPSFRSQRLPKLLAWTLLSKGR